MKQLKNLSKVTIFPLLFLFISSCGKKSTTDNPTTTPPLNSSDADLKSLPKDQGGVQTAVYLNSKIDYGYFVYTPSGYNTTQDNYPLLIFLHGLGEVGNSMTNPGELNKLLVHGPPELISKNEWTPSYPMIVVSPQTTVNVFDPAKVNSFITYIVNHYHINKHRIYLTGLSLGGNGTYNYVYNYPDGYVAAAVPMSAAYDKQLDYSKFKSTPLWTFCGGTDSPLRALKLTTDLINQHGNLVKAKLTVYPGVGHNCWDITYTGSGMGKEDKNYDPFRMSIYDWMFQYSK